MKITLKSSKVAKTGSNKNGKWSLIVVVDEATGIEYTSFDTKANAGVGAVLDIGEPDVKEGKFSFKKCEIISEGKPATETASNGNRSGMTPEMWEKKDLIERASFEAQTAFKGIVELTNAVYTAGSAFPDILEPVLEKALKWAEGKLDANMPGNIEVLAERLKTKLANKSPADPDGIFKDGPQTFDNVGVFFTACQKKGISRAQAIVKLKEKGAINSDDDLPKLDLSVAWDIVNE